MEFEVLKKYKEIFLKENKRVEIEEEIEKKYKEDMMEVENWIKDPQNLGHFYSNQYKKQEDMHYFDLKNFSSYNSQKLYAPVPKWPYKTLTERLILNDIFLMLKGLSNVITSYNISIGYFRVTGTKIYFKRENSGYTFDTSRFT